MTPMRKKKIKVPSPSEQQRRKEHADTVLAQYKWKPGQTGNPNGRTPDIAKGIAMRIAQLKLGKILSKEEIDKLEKLGLKEADITVVEGIMLDWAMSTRADKQALFMERLAGKVPNININAEMSAQLVRRFRAKLTDAELSRIVNGEDALDILLEKLPDVTEQDNVIDSEGWEDE